MDSQQREHLKKSFLYIEFSFLKEEVGRLVPASEMQVLLALEPLLKLMLILLIYYG